MKLQGLFRELFQLDMVDLDFGLYRLFNIKRQEIEDFLTKQLPDEVDEEKTKHATAKRWISAVNNWGNLGQWCFHVSRDPQLLGKELKYIKGK
jgi:hypothetical protein